MGLVSFWKKKPSDQPAGPPQIDSSLPPLGDLPPIDGSTVGFDGSNVQQFNNMQQLPSLDGQPPGNNQSMAINIPTLDFTMPTFDDDGSLVTPPQPPVTPEPVAPEQPAESIEPPPVAAPSVTISEEDLKGLFINDDTWKEPDWANFEPYPQEEKIDEPKPEDFKGEELPTFDDNNEPMIAPSEPIKEKPRPPTAPKPVELFIRGNAYNRVFTELDQMNKSLVKIESQVNTYEDMLKNEELLLIAAKEQMEYFYKKLNIVDKKIFIQ